MIRKALIPFNRLPLGKPFGTAFGKALGGNEDFSPTDISNLVIWLDAGHGVVPSTGPVDSWADRSKNGNNATATLTTRPVVNLTGINGFPSFTYDGTNDRMQVANAASLNFTGSFTAYVVNKVTDLTDFRTMFGKSVNDFRFIYNITDGKAFPLINPQTGTTSPDGTTVNTDGIMELHWDMKVGGIINFSQNGTSLGNAISTISTIVRDTDAFFVGDSGGALQFFKGEIGQVVIYDRLLTLKERNQVGSYLASRYHLPWKDIEPTPEDVPGLVVWLDAARGITLNGADVSAWADQSGNTNNAVQTTATKQPLFQATAFNGFPTLEFDDTTDEHMLIANSTTIDLNTSFTFYVAMNSVSNGSDRFIIGHNSPSGYEIFMDTSESDKVTIGVTDDISSEFITCDTAPTNATDIILEVHYEVGGLISISQSGTLLGELKSNILRKINQSPSDLFIGAKDAGTSAFKGQMAQVLLFNRALSLNERNFIGNYLADRYGLTWVNLKPFDPKDFSGLVAWFDADEGIAPATAGLVTGWTGQSSQAHVAVQADPVKQPFFVQNSPGMNGQPALVFVTDVVGAESLVAPADASLNFTGSFTFYVVTNLRFQDDGVGPITIFDKNGDSGYRWLISNTNLPQIIASASTGGPQTLTGSGVATSTPIILEVNFQIGSANRVKMSQNGASIADLLNALANINSTSAAFDIGGFTGQEFEGLMAQILVYNNLLTSPERNAVGKYLGGRHFLAWQDVPNEVIPTDIPGLVLWLDASRGVTLPPLSGVTAWADQSGQGNDATATGSSTPGFIAGELGGQGALDWDQFQNEFMNIPVAASSTLDLTDDFTFYAVVKLEDSISKRTIVSRNPADGYEFRTNTSRKLETAVNDGTGLETDASVDSVSTVGFQIFEIHYDVGGTINFTQNGIPLGTAPSNTLTAITSNGANLVIGSDNGVTGGNNWHGQIAQILIYNRLLTNEERNRVGFYFNKRFNLPWSHVSFKPDDLNDLTLWLDAAEGVALSGNKVTTWTDQTATPLVATQGTDSKRAIFDATGLNGFPSLDFDGTDDDYTIPDNVDIDITGSFTMYCVCAPNVLDFRTIFTKNLNSGYIWALVTGGKQDFVSSGTPVGPHSVESIGPATISPSESVILEIHYSLTSPSGSSRVNFTKNGLSMGTVASTAITITDNAVQAFLGSSGISTFFNGKIAQLLIYKRLLNTQERNNVGTYLGARFGIPWEEIT